MTEEKAKNIVRGITDKIEATTDIDDWAEFWGFTRDDYEEFLDMTIKALEQQPNEDCVSRKAVIDYLHTNMSWYDENGSIADDSQKLRDITNLVNGIPTVTPTRKKGKWIGEDMLDYADEIITNGRCSCCNFADNIYLVRNFNFCPNCGAEMESGQLLSYADQDTMMSAT